MKHLFMTLMIASIVFSACGNKKPEVDKNTGLTNSSAKTSNSVSSEKLTKALFVQKIWDFTQSPNDWKYLGNKPAIIDFYADWCGPCKIASPILDEVGNEYAGKIQIYKINTDQEHELAQAFGITSIPAFLYIPTSGKPVMMSGIARSKEETKKMFVDNIEKYLLVKK
jgi:thioredoxin